MEGNEISVVQVDVSELLLELGKGVERAGKVLGALDVGRGAVSPAKKHPPPWSSSLQLRARFFSVSVVPSLQARSYRQSLNATGYIYTGDAYEFN